MNFVIFMAGRCADAGHGPAGHQSPPRALITKGEKVEALVAGTVHTRDGVSLALEFTTPGGSTRRLPYPVPQKAKGFAQGSHVTLYYDPLNPKRCMSRGTNRCWERRSSITLWRRCCWAWAWCCR